MTNTHRCRVVVGWLGLILGTRLWYPFFDSSDEDDGTFENRVSALVREVGDRGLAGEESLEEGEPPQPPQPPPPRPTAVAVAAATVKQWQQVPKAAQPPPTTPWETVRTIIQPQQPEDGSGGGGGGGVSTAVCGGGVSGGGGGSMESGAAMQLVTMMFEEARVLREEAKLEKTETKALLSTMRAEREVMTRPAPLQEAISAEQLGALQARLTGLFEAKLLAETEYFELEDLHTDYLELRASAPGVLTKELIYSTDGRSFAYGPVVALARLLAVSEGTASDASFARQLRRNNYAFINSAIATPLRL